MSGRGTPSPETRSAPLKVKARHQRQSQLVLMRIEPRPLWSSNNPVRRRPGAEAWPIRSDDMDEAHVGEGQDGIQQEVEMADRAGSRQSTMTDSLLGVTKNRSQASLGRDAGCGGKQGRARERRL